MSDVQFPSSRELFRLVRAVADIRDPSERMSDVELGRLVGFESARTSRWKYGKIAVGDAGRLITLSQILDIHVTILTQVAAGYLSADEAMEILENSELLVQFIGEQTVLPNDSQVITLTDGAGAQCRVTRRAPGHYHRHARRLDDMAKKGKEVVEKTVILADDNEGTMEVFRNLTGADTGLKGIVAKSCLDALIIAGKTSPQMVILDLFAGGVDGFNAIRTLSTNEKTRDAQIIGTSLSVTPDVVRFALGAGATEVLQRPLRSRMLSRVLGRVRRQW